VNPARLDTLLTATRSLPDSRRWPALGSGLARADDPPLADAVVVVGGAVASEYEPAVSTTLWTRTATTAGKPYT
jgi:hypothetical protein